MTVIVLVPTAVVVPDNSPADDSVIPEGAPVCAQVIVPRPPRDWNWNEYAIPEAAAGKGLVLVCCNGAQLIFRLNCLVAVCAVGEALSVTSTVKVFTPGVVGVPEITPVELLIERPAGNCPSMIVQVRFPIPFPAARV